MRSIALAGIACAALAFAPAGMPRATADNPVCTTANVCAFYSPTHKINCDINSSSGGGYDDTYCETGPPPGQSVHMDGNGVLSICTTGGCVGNPAVSTPTLGYGQNAGIGPFTCRSEVSGITCTVPSGKGFTVSDTAITPVGQ